MGSRNFLSLCSGENFFQSFFEALSETRSLHSSRSVSDELESPILAGLRSMHNSTFPQNIILQKIRYTAAFFSSIILRMAWKAFSPSERDSQKPP